MYTDLAIEKTNVRSDEINATPPAMPGDTRPITYQLTPRPGI